MSNKIKLMLTVSSVLAALFAGCGSETSSSGEETAGVSNNGQSANNNSVLKVPVEASVVQRFTLEQNVPLTGVLKPINAVDVVAEVSGKVTRIGKRLGDHVSPSDTLAFIDDRVPLSQYLQAKAQLLSAENGLKIARLNYRSDKTLFENGDISNLAFENSESEVRSAEAQRSAALAQLKLAEKNYQDTRLISPIIGRVSRQHVDLGTTVTPNMPAYRVVDLSTMKLGVGVAQDIISQVERKNSASVRISALNERIFDGHVQYLSPEADPETGLFPIEIYVENTDDQQLRAGMTARVELALNQMRDQIAVPDYSIVKKDGGQYLYKITGNIARLVQIEARETVGSQTIVTSGIAAGDTIVVVGMKNLGTDTMVHIETVHGRQ